MKHKRSCLRASCYHHARFSWKVLGFERMIKPTNICPVPSGRRFQVHVGYDLPSNPLLRSEWNGQDVLTIADEILASQRCEDENPKYSDGSILKESKTQHSKAVIVGQNSVWKSKKGIMATSEERLENLNLTQEEVKNMTTMMKDPKFMDLFADYAKEISDPNNRKEMENALRDAEKRGERVPGFPSDKDLLIPEAAFCAKTKNEKTGAKVFINVCHSEKIAKPKGTKANDGSGTAWEIPYSLGPAQTDKDKQGAACEVHDFVVSTETHNMARMDRRFKNFLVETAIDAIWTQRRVQVSGDYSLPKLKYKGRTKEPKMLTISRGPPRPPPSVSPVKAGGNGPDQVTKKPSAQKPAGDSKSLIPAPCNNQSPTSGGEVEPKYEVVYRNHLSFTKFWEDKVNLPTEKEKPTHILLRVDLPNVISMQDIELNVTEHDVQLVVPGRYRMQLKLRHPVDSEKGDAQFNTSKHRMLITLPISDPPPQAST